MQSAESVTHVYAHCVTHVYARCREGERSSQLNCSGLVLRFCFRVPLFVHIPAPARQALLELHQIGKFRQKIRDVLQQLIQPR